MNGTLFRTYANYNYHIEFNDCVLSNMNVGNNGLFWSETGTGSASHYLYFNNNMFTGISGSRLFYEKHLLSTTGPVNTGGLTIRNNIFTNINADIAVIDINSQTSAINGYNFVLNFEDNSIWGTAKSNVIRTSVFQNGWTGTGNLRAEFYVNRNLVYINALRFLDVNNGYSTSKAIGYILGVKQNIFTTNQTIHIYERTTNASPTSVVSNTFPQFPKVGGAYYYDANGGGNLITVNAINSLSGAYFDNTNI